MYDHCPVSVSSDVPDLINHLSACFKHLAMSYASHRLRLNPSKSELICFGSRSTLSKIPEEYRTVTVCSSTIGCSSTVRDLGVHFDSELQMKVHVSKITSSRYYRLRRLFQLRNLISQKTRAVPSQGEPRDAAVNFDMYRILQRHRALSVPQHGFLVGLCLQTAVNYLSTRSPMLGSMWAAVKLFSKYFNQCHNVITVPKRYRRTDRRTIHCVITAL